MFSPYLYIHYPRRLLKEGGLYLFALTLFGLLPLFWLLRLPSFPEAVPVEFQNSDQTFSELDLPLMQPQKKSLFFGEEGGWNITALPSRPDEKGSQRVRIALGKSFKESFLPARIYLSYDERGVLHFQEKRGPFFVDFSSEGNRLEALFCIESEKEKQTLSKEFALHSPSISSLDRLQIGNPLLFWKEAQFLGEDLLCQLGGLSPRYWVEIGGALVSCCLGESLIFSEGIWRAGTEGEVIGQLSSAHSTGLEWDVWIRNSYHRVLVGKLCRKEGKPRYEECFHSLRIRSSQQVSCFIDAQCLILRLGDWVFREKGRWKIVRLLEEKERIVKGEKRGELFVLEAIEADKKKIQGRFFLSNRFQVVPIEVHVLSKERKRSNPMHIPARRDAT